MLFGFNDIGFGRIPSGFQIFEIMFGLVFALVMCVFLLIAIKGIRQWNRNNHSPRLTVPAKVVAKRTNVSHHHDGTGVHHSTHTTTYYVTFEVESGDRMELHLAGHEYGLLIEGDYGMLSFQGTRYLGFERK